ncbi:CK1/WORM6 protein kinase [Aphelenchoides avenae]|nr:CK1/WORM6 protein kinase [Aphelenchus avenae]
MSTPDKNDKERLPKNGETVRSETNKEYKLVTALGEGGYGCVFECTDDQNRRWALKAEKYSKSVLRIEINVLKSTRHRQCKHFCQLVDAGKVPHEYLFIVMTLLGADLAKLRNLQPDRHFSLSTAVRVAMQTVAAIDELHQVGYVSRDVKPGNFAIGTKEDSSHRMVFMFDFGLARKYVDKNFNVIPARPDPGWRGTTRYGSLRAHLRQDLGRKDDYESWIYLVIEITKGSLPWRLTVDRTKVHQAKIHARGDGRDDFLRGKLPCCPKQYTRLLEMIDELTFEAAPPYEPIVKLLMEVCAESEIQMSEKYDWEDETTTSVCTSATNSLDRSPEDKHKADTDDPPPPPA